MFAINVSYWFNIATAIFCLCFGNFLQGTMFLVAASVFYAAELIVKELRSDK